MRQTYKSYSAELQKSLSDNANGQDTNNIDAMLAQQQEMKNLFIDIW
jgi:hypothetical protein